MRLANFRNHHLLVFFFGGGIKRQTGTSNTVGFSTKKQLSAPGQDNADDLLNSTVNRQVYPSETLQLSKNRLLLSLLLAGCWLAFDIGK